MGVFSDTFDILIYVYIMETNEKRNYLCLVYFVQGRGK